MIDALDECSNHSVLHSMISSIDRKVPLRILITSRDPADADAVDASFSNAPPGIIQSVSISTDDTVQDIRLLIERGTRTLKAVETEDRGSLADKILDKSKGSFLWTILVLQELSSCHSKNEISQVLEDVPRGMESLHLRTLDFMSQTTRGKNLAKAVLTWAVFAVRPMTIEELSEALSIDIQDVFPRLEESIVSLCGHLVVVDKFRKVQMVDETAREFLLNNKSNPEFTLDQVSAHTRMAEVCLTYFLEGGNELEAFEEPAPSPREHDGDKVRICRLCAHRVLIPHLQGESHGYRAFETRRIIPQVQRPWLD